MIYILLTIKYDLKSPGSNWWKESWRSGVKKTGPGLGEREASHGDSSSHLTGD